MEPGKQDRSPFGNESAARGTAADADLPAVPRAGASPLASRRGKNIPAWIWTAMGWVAVLLFTWAACGGVLQGLLVLPLIGVVIAMFVGIAVWILGPVDKVAKETRGPMQFMLVDFLCLFVLVQLPMALIHGLLTEAELGLRWTLDLYAWISVAAFWGLSVQVLSRAGIRRPRHRAVFLAFVAPSAIVGVVLVPLMTAVAAVALFEAVQTGKLPLRNPHRPIAEVSLYILAYVSLLTLIYLSGRLTRRMVAAGAAAKTEDSDAEDDLIP